MIEGGAEVAPRSGDWLSAGMVCVTWVHTEISPDWVRGIQGR